MGQYYIAMNFNKKEFLAPHHCYCGAKLLEFSYIDNFRIGNEFTSILSGLMDNEWKGDRVYLVGDYADLVKINEADENFLPTLRGLYEEINELGKEKDEKTLTLYDMSYLKGWKEIDFICKEYNEYKKYKVSRYLCNKFTKEYIDLDNLPLEFEAYDYDIAKDIKVSIYPLPLLIAMGNDRGNGDYRPPYPSYSDVGKWVAHSKDIFFSDDIPENFVEYKPDFTERGAER